MNILGKFMERVVKVHVEGVIESKMTKNIAECLYNIRFYNPQALIVTVNSPGGSLSQAKNISDILTNYSLKKKIPLYCFAEDHCLSSAHIILAAGFKSYANEFTMLGDMGYNFNSLWLTSISKKYNIRKETYQGSPNNISMDILTDITPQTQRWFNNYLNELENELKKSVMDKREKYMSKVKQNRIEDGLITAEEAVKNGLIDGIMNCDEIINERYPSTKIIDLMKRGNQKWKNKISKLREEIQQVKIYE